MVIDWTEAGVGSIVVGMRAFVVVPGSNCCRRDGHSDESLLNWDKDDCHDCRSMMMMTRTRGTRNRICLLHSVLGR